MIYKLPRSLPQHAYEAKVVQKNEADVAQTIQISLSLLMEDAGACLFSHIQKNYTAFRSLLVVCGKGNNGGDGYVVARLAVLAGYKVKVLVAAPEHIISGEALIALLKLQALGVQPVFLAPHSSSVLIEEFQASLNTLGTPLIVDALLGIGFSGALSESLIELIAAMNDSLEVIVSADVPSGLCATTGCVGTIAVKAHSTVTFIALKQGLLTGQAASYRGHIVYEPLGLASAFESHIASRHYIQSQNNLPELSERMPTSHKGSIGLALAVGGNQGFPGAIRLSAESAMRSGASLVAVSCHPRSQSLVFQQRPELILATTEAVELVSSTLFKQAKVIVLGPGLGNDIWAQQCFKHIVPHERHMVVDADALRLLSAAEYRNDYWVLTPHPGEAASLLNCDIATIEQDRFYAVKTIAQKYGGICVLKGAGSLVSDGETVWINTTGNAGMASGGMGDVLSGIIAALIMQMPDIYQATRLAVYIHGQAADILADKYGTRGLLASDLLPEVRRLLNNQSHY